MAGGDGQLCLSGALFLAPIVAAPSFAFGEGSVGGYVPVDGYGATGQDSVLNLQGHGSGGGLYISFFHDV